MPFKSKTAERKWRKAYRAKHRDKQNAIAAQTKQQLKAEKRELVNKLKAQPCVDCGQEYPPCVMDFDHVDTASKKANVGTMVGSWATVAQLKVEIAKCELVWANCHRIRTHLGRQRDDCTGIYQTT